MSLWIGNRAESNMTTRQGKAVKKQAYRVSIAHPLYRSLMELYGFVPRPRNMRKRKQSNTLNDEEAEVVEFDDMMLEVEDSENEDTEEEVQEEEEDERTGTFLSWGSLHGCNVLWKNAGVVRCPVKNNDVLLLCFHHLTHLYSYNITKISPFMTHVFSCRFGIQFADELNDARGNFDGISTVQWTVRSDGVRSVQCATCNIGGRSPQFIATQRMSAR
jgi:hypothetical protein